MTIGLLRGKKSKSNKVGIVLFCLLTLVIIFASGMQAYSMYEVLCETNTQENLLFSGVSTLILFSLVMGGLRSSNTKRTQDADFLLSLPIKKSTIVLSKTVGKYFYDFFFDFCIFAPYIIIGAVKVGYSALVIFMGIFICFLMPFLSVGLTFIVDFIVQRIFNKSKYSGILKSIFSLLLFCAIFFWYYLSENNFLTRCLTGFIYTPNYKNILGTLGLTIGVFFVGILLFTLTFGRSTSRFKSKTKKVNFSKPRSPFSLLLRKETAYYFSTPVYFINTIIGPFMMILGLVIVLTLQLDLSGEVMSLSSKDFIALIAAIALSAMSASSTISASSISLEGKNLWLLKSSPVKEKDVFLSKITLHNLVILPAIIVSAVTLFIMLNMSLAQFFEMLILPTLVTILGSVLGLYYNLCFPILDYESETKVIKQSLSVFLTMFSLLPVSALPIILIKLTPLLPLQVFYVSLIFDFILCIVFTFLVFTDGVKRFRKL